MVAQANSGSPDLEAVRTELAASLAREQDLRATLSDQLDTFEKGLDVERALSERESELEGRAAKVAHSEKELQQKLSVLEAEQKTLRAEQKKLVDAQSRLAGFEAAAAKR